MYSSAETTTMFRMMLITITTATSMMALMPSWSASTKTTTLAWSPPPPPSSSRQLGRRPPRRVVCPLFSSSPTMEESAPLPTTSTSSSSSSFSSPLPPRKVTLARWLSAKVQDYPELRDVESLHLSIQMACKTISNLITATTSSSASSSTGEESDAGSDAADDSMRRLDRISKNVLTNALKFTGRLRVVEAPPREECDVRFDDDCPPPVGKSYSPGVVIAYALDQYGGGGGGGERRDGGGGGRRRRLAACFDPLDGSGNADAAICTGTVFGIFDADAGLRYNDGASSDPFDGDDASSLSRSILQPGSELLAAGYCLYSSTTTLVFTLGGGTHGFTLDPTTNDFVLTHPNMKIPRRGRIYSCNESYVDGWDPKFREYLGDIKNGRGETGRRYTQRYIGSMVGDVHRTLMYGGIFCCPADDNVHPEGSLQLVYKSAPMAYVLGNAGGKATDGRMDLLDVRPGGSVHARSPCFMGSPEDMDELMTYLTRE